MRCLSCGTENPAGNRFCSSCGRALSTPEPAVCGQCGAALTASLRFCGNCGAPANAPATTPVIGAGPPPSAPASQQSLGATAVSFLRAINREPSGAAALAVIFILGAVLSWIGWLPLSVPTRAINAVVPEGNCINVRPGSTEMYFCSAKVAALTQVGPILVMVVLVLARKAIANGLRKITPKLPTESHFLIGPLVATALFASVWGAVHSSSYVASGILPQTVFPALIGVFTFATARYGPSLQRMLSPVFDLRDKFPRWLRFVGAMLIPLVLALIITAQERVSQEAFKEQFIVLVSLTTSYLALAPRTGSLLAGVRQAMQGRR